MGYLCNSVLSHVAFSDSLICAGVFCLVAISRCVWLLILGTVKLALLWVDETTTANDKGNATLPLEVGLKSAKERQRCCETCETSNLFSIPDPRVRGVSSRVFPFSMRKLLQWRERVMTAHMIFSNSVPTCVWIILWGVGKHIIWKCWCPRRSDQLELHLLHLSANPHPRDWTNCWCD